MPRGIAARYTTSATPTTEPNTSLEKRAFRAAAIQRGDKAVQAMVRYWCVNATAVESSACEALRAGGPCRGSARMRQPRTFDTSRANNCLPYLYGPSDFSPARWTAG